MMTINYKNGYQATVDDFRKEFMQPFDKIFDEYYKTMSKTEMPFGINISKKSAYPKVDIISRVIQGDKYAVIKADLPGFTKDEINIEIKDTAQKEKILVISAKHVNKQDTDTLDTFHLKERISDPYRSFFVSDNLFDLQNIDASLENGVLELKIPFAISKKETNKKINIK